MQCLPDVILHAIVDALAHSERTRKRRPWVMSDDARHEWRRIWSTDVSITACWLAAFARCCRSARRAMRGSPMALSVFSFGPALARRPMDVVAQATAPDGVVLQRWRTSLRSFPDFTTPWRDGTACTVIYAVNGTQALVDDDERVGHAGDWHFFVDAPLKPRGGAAAPRCLIGRGNALSSCDGRAGCPHNGRRRFADANEHVGSWHAETSYDEMDDEEAILWTQRLVLTWYPPLREALVGAQREVWCEPQR